MQFWLFVEGDRVLGVNDDHITLEDCFIIGLAARQKRIAANHSVNMGAWLQPGAVEHCVVAKSRRGSFLPAGLVLVLSGSTLRSSGAHADYCIYAVVLKKQLVVGFVPLWRANRFWRTST